MGKTAKAAIEGAKLDIARTIARAVRVVTHGIGKRTPEECKQAFEQNMKDAPIWAHASVKLAGQYVVTQGQKTGSVPAGLAVVVVQPALTVDDWQKQADQFRSGKVIDVPAEKKGESR